MSVTVEDIVNASPVLGFPVVVSVICGLSLSITFIQRLSPALSVTSVGPEFAPVPLNNWMKNVPLDGADADIAVKFSTILSPEEVLLK